MKQVAIKLYSIDELPDVTANRIIAKHFDDHMGMDEYDYHDDCIEEARIKAGDILKLIGIKFNNINPVNITTIVIDGNIDIRKAITALGINVKTSVIKAIERNYTFHISSDDNRLPVSRANKHPRLDVIINDIINSCVDVIQGIVSNTLFKLDKPRMEIMDKIKENKWLYRENGEQYYALNGDKEIK